MRLRDKEQEVKRAITEIIDEYTVNLIHEVQRAVEQAQGGGE